MGSVATTILNDTCGRPGRVITAGIHGVTVSRSPSVKSSTTIESQWPPRDRFGFRVLFLALYKPFASLCFGRRVRLVPSCNQTGAHLPECTRPVAGDIIIRSAGMFRSKANQLWKHCLQQHGRPGNTKKESRRIRSVALQRKSQTGGYLKQLPVWRYDLASITPGLPEWCCLLLLNPRFQVVDKNPASDADRQPNANPSTIEHKQRIADTGTGSVWDAGVTFKMSAG